MGKDYNKFGSLDYVLTFLENFLGKGERIILTGLKSPVTRNRNIAINVLNKWKRENWSPEIVREVKRLSEIEPNEDTKRNINRLLSGLEIND